MVGCAHPATPAAAPPATLEVFVVRHAEKILDKGSDPALTEAGAARAAALPRAVPLDRLVAIYSTNTRRTRATVKPVADRTQLEIRTYAPSDYAALLEAIRSYKTGVVLVAGHSNTLPPMLEAFGVVDTVTIDDDQYGDLFVITLSEDSATMAVRKFGE